MNYYSIIKTITKNPIIKIMIECTFQTSMEYKEFDPSREVGAQETKGLTANIGDISKEYLITAYLKPQESELRKNVGARPKTNLS